MVEEEPGSVENDLPAAEPPPRHDFSVVQGFQVVDAEDHRSASRLSTPKIIAQRERATKRGAKP